MTPEQPGRRALVTGATRGIGRATAVALAAAGWDVAVTGRTARRGEGRDDSDTGEGRPLPGSLEETGEGIRAEGSRALELVADLHDHDALRAAVDRTIDEWGGVDLLVNNAVDTAPGSMVPIVELGVAQLEAKLAANAVAPFVLIQSVLPGMLARGSGTIVDVTSHTATADPPGPVGQGGWGVAYAASKAAAHRFAPLLAVELGDRGIRAYNLDPGYVETERQVVNAAALGLVGRYSGAPPTVPAAAIAWMVDHPDALENGQTVRGLKLALVEGLHPDLADHMTGPESSEGPVVTVYRRSGCPYCGMLRRGLKRAGVPTVEIDIWKDPEAAAYVRAHAGGNETVPTVVVADSVLVNPAVHTVVALAADAGVVAVPVHRWFRPARA